MYERKIYNQILRWKESLKIKKRALVIKGLRQIGKTTIVEKFCKEHYKNVVYINFMNDESIKAIFDKDLKVNDIIRGLSSALPESRFIPYETVIIFDELQECVNARSSIKPFMIDGRFDIIATGSLIGLRGYNKKVSKGIPTGFEQIITMYPMDFEEFLWAKGINKDVINYIKECFEKKEKVSEAVNLLMNDYFKEYLCVGGLPDVVNMYFSTYDMNAVYDIQKSILEDYKDDFGKHLDVDENITINKKELSKIMEVYNSLPAQLSKENKKFQYSVVANGAKSREYRSALTWLEEFGLINLCYNLNTLELPLEGNKINECFKVYISDTGLLMAMLEKGTVKNILNGDLKIYKGAIFENIVADAFIKLGKKLYYYSKNSGVEIDFVTRFNNEITVIEVKSTNGNSKSLNEILTNKKYNVNSNFKLINGNIGNNNKIQTIPLYMAFLINED